MAGANSKSGPSAPESRLDYPLIDADTHYYEPRDFITRCIDPAFRDRAVHVRRTADGLDELMFGDEPLRFLTHHSDFDRAPKPGGLREQFRALKKTGRLEKGDQFGVPMDPAWQGWEARLAQMDDQGVGAALAFPTRGVCFEHLMRRDPDVLYANLRAFNQWLYEDWGYARGDRLFTAPLMNLTDISSAVEELELALERGARAVHLQCGPQGGRSPADPVYDPFWARIDEAGVPVAFHIGATGLNEMYSTHWNEQPDPPAHQQSAFQWTCFYGDTPIMQTLAALIFHNLFGRFPNIHVLSVEHGSLWVAYLMAAMDKMKGMGRNGPWPGGYVPGRPSEIFREHVYVVPYHEDPMAPLAAAIGDERVLFGSDYPHSEGVADPVEFVDALTAFEPDRVQRIMRENAAELFQLG
jgi:predicted TIM-barrel fold metal-dependent hydrolase